MQALDNNFEGSVFATEESFTIGTIGIENYLAQKVSIYPNPSQGFFTIQFVDKQNMKQIMVTDFQGSEVYSISGPGKELSLDLTEFGKGVYFIRIILDNESVIEKVIVN